MAFIGCLNSHLDYGYGLTGIRTQRTRDETLLPKSLLIFLLLDYHTILIVFSCFVIPLVSHMSLFRLVRCFVFETGEILARDATVLGSRIDSIVFLEDSYCTSLVLCGSLVFLVSILGWFYLDIRGSVRQ